MSASLVYWYIRKTKRNVSVFTNCNVEKNLQGCFEENPKSLLTTRDSQGNTVAHLVAASGNAEVFKVWKSVAMVMSMFTANSKAQTRQI